MSAPDLLQPVLALIELGGPVVVLIAGLSVIALALLMLKLGQFLQARVGRPGRARAAVLHWSHGRRGDAWRAVNGATSAAEEAVAMAMRFAERPDGDKARIEEDIARVATERFHRLGRGLKALDSIAQIAPLLGLFGTVLGMIEAFQQLQSAGNAVDPSALAGGIWVALLTTATGLAVAMPVSLAVTYLEERLESERVAVETLPMAILLHGVSGPALPLAEEVPTLAPRVAHAH